MALRWKVCGITSVGDALLAIDAGADAIGFVFHPPSPRNVSVGQAAAIAARLPAETWRVGVFVDRPGAEMDEMVEAVGLDFLQLSGDEPPSAAVGRSRHAFKALRLRPGHSAAQALDLAAHYPDCTLLVDAAVPGQYGGTGVVGNWSAAAALAKRYRLMLAGGLDASNVAEAIRAVRPWAIDVSSGVEAEPGRKQESKLRAFAQAMEPFR